MGTARTRAGIALALATLAASACVVGPGRCEGIELEPARASAASISLSCPQILSFDGTRNTDWCAAVRGEVLREVIARATNGLDEYTFRRIEGVDPGDAVALRHTSRAKRTRTRVRHVAVHARYRARPR